MQLPNFMIVGANKAGTTSLAYYCGQHPEIFMSAVKEPMFFTSVRQDAPKSAATLQYPFCCFTLKEYADLFAGTSGKMRGEASTAYLANPSCALWIKKIIPDVKIIAILRNPIERAFSAYKMFHGNGVDNRPFEEAVINEIRHGVINIPQGQQYLTIGLYSSQIKIFKDYFQENMLIGDYDEYNNNTLNFLKKIFNFLGVADFAPSDLRRLNISSNHFSDPIDIPYIDKSLLTEMRNFFEKDIAKLQSMVEFDVMKWLASPPVFVN